MLQKCTKDQLEMLAMEVCYTKDSSKITKTVLTGMILSKGDDRLEEIQARRWYDMLDRSGTRDEH